VFKECSVKEKKNIKEVNDAILKAAMEPLTTLTEEGISRAEAEKGGSEFWSSYQSIILLGILTLIGGGLVVKYKVLANK
jgi:hypothetical protein